MLRLKWLNWLCKLVVGTAIVSVLTLTITSFTVNMVVQQILQQFNLQGLVPDIKMSDVVSSMINGTSSKNPNQTVLHSPAPSAKEEQKQGAQSQGQSQSSEQIGSQTSPSPSPAKPDDAVGVWSQISGSESSSSGMVMSIEDFAKKKDQMSSEDKMKIFSTIASKVPEKEVQRLSTIVENGITKDEAKEMDTILQKYLKPDEYAELLTIVTKK
ncbi:hypothetical protein NV379_09945 [Paenibacillus sp. N1-5-1-14]|uniref:hypothetical protein n=1 Tax=Paenibacillus radicibacter TaxID=2972488 RepID=UPI002158A73E|nr:hypothetical protein [Paenibacillus radicibacter]MCR8642981.1 hypothetical protein [Paenibacillus radicibacter]